MGKPAWLERAHRARGVPSPGEPQVTVELSVDASQLEEALDSAGRRELVDEFVPDRATCPDCGRDVAVNKDGSLRKHACSVDQED